MIAVEFIIHPKRTKWGVPVLLYKVLKGSPRLQKSFKSHKEETLEKSKKAVIQTKL